jgi:tetratricopeptide (TPR) repeat protein
LALPIAFAGTGRFEILRPLGRGGMGVVFEVLDREHGTIVALKLLPELTPSALLRFKREFRALQGLSHPNLIALGELASEGDHWFFTMELVRGTDLRAWVRAEALPSDVESAVVPAATLTLGHGHPCRDGASTPSPSHPPVDEGRLRDALRQLADGLRFLHAAGKAHCDVKPSNVLVTETGRVVLLDFGLVAEAESRRRDSDGTLRGTPAYMAPELADGGRAGPAADMYSLGVILFELLTGERPFHDSSLAGLLLRGAALPPRPSERATSVASDLDDLALRLLDPNPRARPRAGDAVLLLGGEVRSGSHELHAPLEAAPFVGRRDEMTRMLTAQAEGRDHPVMLVIEGASGIGKTALLHELLREIGAGNPPGLILRGRCCEHETIPYKAIDGIMDDLADYLTGASDALPAPPADGALLAVLFPVLGRVPAFASTTPVEVLAISTDGAHERRRNAERAARGLLALLAQRQPVILAIDDFQWADADSKTLLSALARAPDPPPFTLVVSSRNPVDLPFAARIERLGLEPLSRGDACTLAAALLGEGGASPNVRAEAIAKESGGHPFFISELVRRPLMQAVVAGVGAAPSSLDDMVWERIQRLGDEPRAVLEVVAVAATPTSQNVVAEAAGLSRSSFGRAAHQLRIERMIRTEGLRSGDAIESYHDRIRETVVSKLTPAARSQYHRTLASVLERHCPDDVETLVTHCDGAGDRPRAAHYAIIAGDRAHATLAFERAADFYRRAIEGLPAAVCRDEELHLKLADTLANAGMCADAAASYTRAASDAHPRNALELRRRAAEQLLSSGRLDEGLSALASVLAQVRVRMPATPLTAFLSLLFHRAQIALRGVDFTERDLANVAEPDVVRVDTLWAAAARLGVIDNTRAADFQAQHLLLSLDLGEPFRVARALLAEAIFVSLGGPPARRRTEALLERARGLVARLGHPYADAMLPFTEGLAAYQAGRYLQAFEGLERAAELLRAHCTGVSHDIAVSNRFAIDCLFNLGDLDELCRRVPALLEDAERRGDMYLVAELKTGLPNVAWLCADRPAEALRATDQGIARWPQRTFYLQHYYHALASAHIALYVGHGREAHLTAERAWRGLRRSLLLRVQAVRTEALYLRARAAIAEGSRRALGVASKAVAKLESDAIPAAPGLALAARAGIAAVRGNRAEASSYLREAERAFRSADMAMHAAACRFHLWRLDRASRAAASASEAETWMRDHGVVRPDRFAHLLIAGMPR